MDCKEAEQLIQSYIDRDMDYDNLHGFMQHIGKCKECRDELEIRLLIKEGLQSLEKGESFDLSRELNGRLKRSGKAAYIIERAQTGIYIVELVAGMILAGCAAVLFIQ